MLDDFIMGATFVLLIFALGWGFRPPTHAEWLASDNRQFQAFVSVVICGILMASCAGLVKP